MLIALIEENKAALALEERKIEEAIADARRTGASMHDNYWKRHYALRERQRLLTIALEEITNAIAD